MIDLHDDLAAALAGRYQVERELGRGGMAVVYLARDVKHSRHVAVKVLRPDLASTIGAERFLREIDVAARLTHPNILTLHDSGSAEGGALLYYVMPWVEGETLRARLDREHQLPVDEALAITRQVAAALDYAHARGVVHRDVKPENILLTGEHACVADFGLARALYAASTRRLTESAVAVGTPAYMSPEQAAADPDVDGRADVYSLGCVVYEMLAGTAPYRGATAQAVLAQHLTAPVPSICGQRPHCPAAVDAAVQRAMEKIPADRFRTAGEMVKAMAPSTEAGAPTLIMPSAPGARRRRWPMAIALAVIVLAALGVFTVRRGMANRAAPLDASTYIVVPLAAGNRPDSSGFADRIASALSEWDGVRVGDDHGAAESAPSTDDALAAARGRGAGRAVIGRARPRGDSIDVNLGLYDVAASRQIRQLKLSFARAAGPGRRQLRTLASDILRGAGDLPWKDDDDDSRPVLAAWQAYDRARTALAEWDVGTAARELRDALALQPDFPQAQLWLAVTLSWARQPVATWRSAARRAVESSRRLAEEDSVVAAAQLALADGRFPESCAAFSRVVRSDSSSVVGLYGLGECQSRDSLVVREPRSPSGYTFRSSYQRAINDYASIVTDRPAPHPPFVYARLAELLFTAGNRYRPGRLASGAAFGAYPSFEAETLAFVPYPLTELMHARVPQQSAKKAEAIEHNRAFLRGLYTSWAQSAPSSAEAHASLGQLLEATEALTGGSIDSLLALREIHHARQLARDEEQRRGLIRDEIRLLVKSSHWPQAATLADSLFASVSRVEDDSSGALLGPAALTGRLRVGADVMRARHGAPSYQLSSPSGEAIDLPPAVQQDAAMSFMLAASGACVDSLRGFPRRIDGLLESYVGDPTRRAVVRNALLRRPLSLAVPCLGPSAVAAIDAGGDKAVLMEQALARNDLTSLRATYQSLLAARAPDRPGDVSIDYTFLESWLLAAAGDTTQAIEHLDRTLTALPTLGSYLLDFPSQSAALVRAMGLRAELADRAGDPAAAARWGAAVATLWAGADPPLRPYVARMRAFAASAPGPPVSSR